jgi:uncharacterized protein
VILPDANVLVYAFRSDAKSHAKYRRWLEGVVNGPAAYGISPQVLAGVMRICTHPRIFVRPSSSAETLDFCTTLLDQPNAVPVVPGERHWPIFARLCRDSKAAGNLVAEAWLAALAIESGCEWITTDRDYAQFEGLRWRAP